MKTAAVLLTLALLAATQAGTGPAPAGERSRYVSVLETEEGRLKLACLALMEERRSIDPEKIRELSVDPDPLVRIRTAEVLGRVAEPGGIPHLERLLADSDPSVAETAVFSLGLIGGTAAIEPLAAALKVGSRTIKMRALESLGRSGVPGAAEHIVPCITDFHSPVRAMAALALTALGDTASALACMHAVQDPDPHVAASVVYMLGRLGVRRATDRILPLVGSRSAEVRLRAVEALGRLEAGGAVKTIAAVLPDADRYVTIKGLEALGRIGSRKAAAALLEFLDSGDAYMRATALAGIATSAEKGAFDAVLPLLGDPSLMVRAAALRAAAKTGREKARPHLLAAFRSGSTVERSTALELLGSVGNREDLPLLAGVLASDGDHLLRQGAATGLGNWSESADLIIPVKTAGGMRRPVDLLLDAADGEDWVVAAIAAESLGKTGTADIIPGLLRIYATHTGRLDADRRLEVIRAVSKLCEIRDEKRGANSVITAFLRTASMDTDPRLAREAAGAAAAFGLSIKAQPAGDWNRGIPPWSDPPLPLGERRIVVTTDRGEFEITLFGDDAPGIVAGILALAREDFYSGLTFHRVVPGFVIQGGCPRGDGWGDAGYFLRSQFNLHRYERGMVGMAHAGKDTPGSQIFITHTSQPHLDGRYTIVGRVTRGMDIVDAIEIGDTFGIRMVE